MPMVPGTSGRNDAATLDALESAIARDAAFLDRMLADLPAGDDRGLRSGPTPRGGQPSSREAVKASAESTGGLVLTVVLSFALGFGWAALALAVTAAAAAVYFRRVHQRRWLVACAGAVVVLLAAAIVLFAVAPHQKA